MESSFVFHYTEMMGQDILAVRENEAALFRLWRLEDSVKNTADAVFYHTAICFWAKANSFDGRTEIACADFSSPLRVIRSEMRIKMTDRKLFCNGCGRTLKYENDILREDVFEGKKQWGYFSERDGEIHSFLLCEDCYNEMVKKFVIPPEVTEATEL